MYNVNDEMKKFYRNHVVLKTEVQKELIDKKDLNLTRLKEGLKEFNDENGTTYVVVDSVVQGSVAMQTVIQSEACDYDIDVGVIFNKYELPEPSTESQNNTQTIKNNVHAALLKRATTFKNQPEKLTNCIRVQYANNYHIDFALYRREKNEEDNYIYEHCGPNWNIRNPRAITRWFKERDKVNTYKLKRVVRLIKTYLKQNATWDVPGGLIQSVLANECIFTSDRLDIMLYETIKAIIDRLTNDIEVYNPIDVDENGNQISLLQKESHRNQMTKMKNYLSKGISKLSVLFEDTCTKEKALRAWGDFFNNSYWSGEADLLNKSLSERSQIVKYADNQEVYDFNESEEDIEEYFPINIKYSVAIDADILSKQNGSIVNYLRRYLGIRTPLKTIFKLNFKIISINVPGKYDIYWKILNCGKIAEKKNTIRGEIVKGSSIQPETCDFEGDHMVYCYIVKNNEVVAMDSISVPIRNY